MGNLQEFGELGAVVIAMVIILGLVEVIRRRYRESESGERRITPTMVIECPNKVDGLHLTLNALVDACKEQTKLSTRQLEHLVYNKQILDVLLKAHAPQDGREWWKTTEKAEAIQEEIRDGIKELVRLIRQNGGSS